MSVQYKYKPEKHKYRKNHETIDEIHEKKVNEFSKNHVELPKKKKQLQKLKTSLDKINSNKGCINLDHDITKKINKLKEGIFELEEDIKRIENHDYELEYFSKSGDILFDFYDLTNGQLYNNSFESKEDDNNEKHKNIEISSTLKKIKDNAKKKKIKKPTKKRKKIDLSNQPKIMSFFKVEEDSEENNENDKCRSSLERQYLIMMNKDYACDKSKRFPIKKCSDCKISMVVIYSESILSCPKCGQSEDILIESDIPSQRETFTEKPKYPYQRIGHCQEKLNQFLCKGTMNVPKEIIDIIDKEIIKHSFDRNKISSTFIEKVLKKHKLSEYYENIMYIYSKITNTQPLTISRDEYDIILDMFSKSEKLYIDKFKPKDRQNFLKYTFVLNKIFLILDKPLHAKHCKLLKSEQKTKNQEKIWKLICREANWKYYSSIEHYYNEN